MNANTRRQSGISPAVSAAITDTMRQSFWASVCCNVEGQASLASAHCFAEFAGLLYSLAKRFCDREPPRSESEAAVRQIEKSGLGEIVSAIVSLNDSALRFPGIRQQLFALAKTLTKLKLPRSESEKAELRTKQMAVSSVATGLCDDELSRMIRR